MANIVPDTSVLVSGILSDLITKGENHGDNVIIPEFVVEELRAQASKGRETGFKGLEELKRLREFHERNTIKITRTGRRQTYEEIQLAKYGRIDALILDVAREEKAALYTSDMVQALVGEADGIETRYFQPYERKKETMLSQLMTDDTMSLHLKESVQPLAKRGAPGKIQVVRFGEPLGAEQLEHIIVEIMDAARYEENAFVETGGHAASVVQLGNMRITITRPPFSDGIEITVVRPIAKLSLDDYHLSEKLMERLNRAEGILIAGPPGSGKSTFAAAVAEHYERTKNAIVKTLESPRDLQVKPEITQYTKLHGNFENAADILLLVRPDYTIFDEVRKTDEFKTFADLRLAGIGMVGVVHASQAVDAIQRFMGRVELGLIPHVVDTVIFIHEGIIKKIYYLSLVVRTPTGMTESDLARPVVEVRDFESNGLEYEIYTYGEENVIIPVKGDREPAINRLARKQILTEIRRFDDRADVEILSGDKVLVTVDNDVIPRIIGKEGRTIKQLEERLGISIEVVPRLTTLGKEVSFEVQETGAYFVFSIDARPGKVANFYIGGQCLFSATIGKSNEIRVSKHSDMGKDIMKGIINKTIKIFV